MSGLPAGRHFFRGDDGYEPARRATVWNQRVPERYPDLIVQAVDADEVVAAIRYAQANGHRVSIRSGGHSWSANHLRDGAVLLDVSRIDHAERPAEFASEQAMRRLDTVRAAYDPGGLFHGWMGRI